MCDSLYYLQAVSALVDAVEKMDAWVDEIPPVGQPQRFGNKAYRTWFSRMEEVCFFFFDHHAMLLK